VILCGAPTVVRGAKPCPRAKNHPGVHYWWIPWLDGRGEWRVVVYTGEPEERVRLARGVFCDSPSGQDVAELLRVLSPLKHAEKARRTPHSEPVGTSKALYAPDLAGMVPVG
jgi:hypothetical protein